MFLLKRRYPTANFLSGEIEDSGGADNLVERARCNQTEFYKMLIRLMPREIHADVNTGFTLVECLREQEEQKAKH